MINPNSIKTGSEIWCSGRIRFCLSCSGLLVFFLPKIFFKSYLIFHILTLSVPVESYNAGKRDAHEIRVIKKLPNTEQSSKGKLKTHKSINRQNQSNNRESGKQQLDIYLLICFQMKYCRNNYIRVNYKWQCFLYMTWKRILTNWDGTSLFILLF